jgi:hypothetical protein
MHRATANRFLTLFSLQTLNIYSSSFATDPSAVLAATNGFRGISELIVAIIKLVAESNVHATVASAGHFTMNVPRDVTTTTSFLISADPSSASAGFGFVKKSIAVVVVFVTSPVGMEGKRVFRTFEDLAPAEGDPGEDFKVDRLTLTFGELVGDEIRVETGLC